jgi:hypothetical protein
MLLGQVVKDNVVRVTDLHSPGRDTVKNAGNSLVAEAVRRLGIAGAAFARVTAAAASKLISTQSRRDRKTARFRQPGTRPQSVPLSFHVEPNIIPTFQPALRRPTESLCEEET